MAEMGFVSEEMTGRFSAGKERRMVMFLVEDLWAF
jgi:hypothetical protein